MAGSQDQGDNPVAVNVVPLVDVIFCLCVFFMCSFKFRQLEGRFETWLPDTGHDAPPSVKDVVELTEMRVAVLWNDATRTVTRKFGLRTVDDDAELRRAVAESRAAWAAKGRPDAPLTIDADARAPWKSVVDVVDVAKCAEVASIQFALGAEPTRARR